MIFAESSFIHKKIMRTATITICLCLILIENGLGQPLNKNINDFGTATITTTKKKTLNFFIISKRKKGQLDLASRFNVFRAKVKGLFRKKKFIAIVANSGNEASDRMC